MSEVLPLQTTPRRDAHGLNPVTEPRAVRWLLTGIALAFLAFFLVVPLVAVFVQAFAKGIDYYFESLKDPDAWSAIKLTLITAAIAVPLNVVFGLAASWAIAKFEFRGKALLTTLIDLPFSVSPVISGLRPLFDGRRRCRLGGYAARRARLRGH